MTDGLKWFQYLKNFGENWVAAGWCLPAIQLVHRVLKDAHTVEVSLDTIAREEYERLFRELRDMQTELQQGVGHGLVFEHKPGKNTGKNHRTSWKIHSCPLEGGWIREADWPNVQATMIRDMDKLARVFEQPIRDLASSLPSR
jgi:hypothetical protein